MKKTLVICTILALLLSFGCAPAAMPVQAASAPQPAQASAPAEKPAQAAQPAEKSAQAARLQTVYKSMLALGVLPEMMRVGGDLVSDFYGIEAAQYADAVFYISYDNLLADEVVLVTAADEAAAAAVEELLNARLAAKAEEADGYSPEQAAIIKACKVTRSGLELALIVSPEAQALTRAYEAGLAG